MRLLAIDLGKFKSVACLYEDEQNTKYHTIETRPQVIHDLLVQEQPDRLAIEVGTVSGWVCDLARALEIEVEVANPNTEGWRWKRVKRKTDRDDALKLARLSITNQLPTVWMPEKSVRQWRSLINYRHELVSRRTAIRNTIRSILDANGQHLATGNKAWSVEGLKHLKSLCGGRHKGLWQIQIQSELILLTHLQKQILAIETKLDRIAAKDERTERLRTIPGVGARMSEAIVAWIDDPNRFKNARAVGSYAGLVPKRLQSGTYDRSGRITKQGPGLLRKLLVEVAWMMRRHNPLVKAMHDKMSKGEKSKRKQSMVAIARKLLTWCWAMMRDGTIWDPQKMGIQMN